MREYVEALNRDAMLERYATIESRAREALDALGNETIEVSYGTAMKLIALKEALGDA